MRAVEADPADGGTARGLAIGPGRVVPETELVVRRSRSGGPGGQNVNKVSTRIEIEFDVAASAAFDTTEKTRILTRLRGRSSRGGVVRVVAQRFRSQARNEQDARRRLAELLAGALVVPKTRRPTRRPTAARERRLESKKRRAAIKSARRDPGPDD